MNIHENTPCELAEQVRDYAFDELAAGERRNVEQHLAVCVVCAAELDRLRLTTAALRILPDVEVPRRITFVADRPVAVGWFAGFWNSAARLGFASACVLAAGVSFAAFQYTSHRQPEVHTTIAAAAIPQAQIDEAVSKAVAMAVEKTHAEDVRITKAALESVDAKYAQKQQNLMIAVSESMDVERKRLEQYRKYAMAETPRSMGAGQ